ncbi:MAG: acetylglutamate kinase [Amylibacter sp.]|jgi:acetylglutamate kinase|nr:acetylglutamate kinase [Amylibacter sp.]MDA8741372.1 acetylglutamate kinase [Amylibacter sp.]MDA8803513.1 acetylglutamate kinase [Amylibacter sp.]MDA8812028.1 acetylglutamate kinase [Amylibacter sp.]MDA9581926.1 acetylglutamate kinase [Amylibacter sp.]
MERDSIATARMLSEALPHIQRHDGSIVVIKLGGHAISSDKAMKSFARDIVLMHQCNLKPVIVHGGGPMINEMLDKLNIQTKFVEGKRVSTPETVDVVEMVLSGKVNKTIVQAINSQGGKAVGLSGKDANLLQCKQVNKLLGMVGDPYSVNADVIHSLIENDFIPVIAPLGSGENGETYNVNGDTAAGAIAGGLKADRLLLLTDVDGVKDKDGDVLTNLSAEQVNKMTKNNIIVGGMIPKTQTALDAISDGVRAVVIMDGRVPNACLLELFTDHGAGSMIRA